jgi:hypothetical protein
VAVLIACAVGVAIGLLYRGANVRAATAIAAAVGLVALVAPTGAAQPAATPPAGAAQPPAKAPVVARPRQVRPPKPPVEPPPLPNVSLRVEAPTTRGAWTVRVSNQGDVPVRIAADARLVTLDVLPRGARQSLRCELPPDMRPDNDLGRPLVLPPGRSYAESFEPRLYCFGGQRLAALAPGTIVVARLGWLGKATRFSVISPIDGVEPKLASRPYLDAPPIVLPDEPTPQSMPTVIATPPVDDPPRLSLRSSETSESDSASGVEVPVTLRNDGTRTVILRFRPETVRFDVSGPGGADHCTWPAQPTAPTRDLFTTLGPGASTSLRIVLGQYCAAHTFDESGLFVVRARLDTRGASGSQVGLRTFDGEVIALSPTLVRLHRGRSPKPLAVPRLEP